MNNTLTYIRPGAVVEFMHGDQPQLAWVLEEQSGKLRIWTINKREMKLPSARVLPWYGPGYDPNVSKQEIQDKLNAHQEKRGQIHAGLDVMELWELSQGEMEKARLEWFADLLWEDPDADRIAALGRAMLAAKTHFKFRPPYFEIYPAEKVEERLRIQAEEKEREAVVTAGQDIMRLLWDSKSGGYDAKLPKIDPEVETRLQQVLLDQIGKSADERSEKIWTAVRKGLPDLPHIALMLAQKWGILPPHHNHLLNEAHYAWGDEWSKEHADEIDEQFKRFEKLKQEPEDIPFVSIDAATTKDIDDAFFIERTEQGYRLQLALARPMLTWDFGSPLDRVVADRVSSVYLPEGSTHMMPEALGTGLYSLHAGEPRPACVAEIELDKAGEILSVAPRLAWVRLKANTTYEAVEKSIAEGDDEQMITAHELAEALIQKRIDNGACIIRKPEPVVTVEGDGPRPEVSITLKEPCPESELVVSEFMILANCALALWGRDNEVPLLHRCQDIALPADAAGIFSDPTEILQRVRLLMPATTEVQPKRHAALGVPAYTSLTSPLRRYLDFINMAQVCSFLETGTPRLSADELESGLPNLNARAQAVGQIQRFRPRYWKLFYLSQQRKKLREAIVVEENGPLPCLALPELQINVRAPRKILGDKLYPGQRFQINFGRIDPLTNEIKIAEAYED
ncbi:ribonuclease catalytic domain-containing protein [Salidesulfovibrio onnuriiensis]|uniref:ribonuclease catalytic domain-containing protein n=1 Tax=Salidesulfovibrio onnuriiensis TaxID=2583823 RepID=UPI0011CA8D1A|nr:ribonuclease catalytic domain-containing protein [Salidesulfovibrio onnuriiensis]